MLSVTPEGQLQNGETAEICITGGQGPGTVTVTITNAGTPPATQTVEITLDDQGNGCANWTVANWDLARFNAPGCEEVTRPIAS